MNKRELEKLAEPTVDVYMSIEEEILVNIAKTLKRVGNLDDINAWQMTALSEMGKLNERNIKLLSEQSGQAEDAIKQALEDAGFGEIEKYEDNLQEGVELGVLSQAQPVEDSPQLLAILQTYESNASNRLNMVNTTMIKQSEQAYLDIINKVQGAVLAGAKTPQEALRDSVKQWSNDGIPALVDRRGHKWTTEAYVNMITRTVTNDVANEMQEQRMKEYGNDLVEVSAYSGAREKCFEDQGKVYSMSGTHDTYPSWSTTTYGDADGLLGVNCSHSRYPFIEGVTERTYKPYDKEENDRIYKNSQRQRYLERQIRHAKRELRAMEALGDDKGVAGAKQSIRDKQARLRKFIEKTGRTRRRDREQVY